MDTKQIKMIEWLSYLQQFTKDERLPIRLIDRIEDCKELVTQKKPNWNQITIETEALLESIIHKVQGIQKEVIVNEESEVSIEEIKKFIREATEREHNESISSLNNILYREKLIEKECYQKMNEITFVEANIEKIEDVGRFLQFFQNIKENYERNEKQLLHELMKDVEDNLTYMMEQIRNMFQSIEGSTISINNKKFYIEYTQRKESIDNDIKSKIETADLGGRKIVDFANSVKNNVKKGVYKFRKKDRFFKFLPLLLIAICVFGFKALSIVKTPVSNDKTELIKEIIKNIINGELFLISEVFAIIIIPIVIFIIVLIVRGYMKYCKILRQKYEAQISSYCGDYLKTEIYNFEKENQLDNTEEIKRLVFEYEQQYRDILNCIFENTQLDPFGKEELANTKIEQIKESWNQIKYM